MKFGHSRKTWMFTRIHHSFIHNSSFYLKCFYLFWKYFVSPSDTLLGYSRNGVFHKGNRIFYIIRIRFLISFELILHDFLSLKFSE